MTQVPTIGRIVHYTLTEHDADAINRRRQDGARNLDTHRIQADGTQVHIGNTVDTAEVYPMVITRVWSEAPGGAVNGQVLLDGNDTLWVSSVSEGEGERHYAWPKRA